MPTVGTDSKYLSELIAGPVPFVGNDVANFHTARVNMRAVTSAITGAKIGQPLVYNATGGITAFVPFVAQTISDVTTSTLPDLSPVCLLIGNSEGAGIMPEDGLDITADTNAVVTVLYRGPIAVKQDGIEFGGVTSGAAGANGIALKAQLEAQGIRVLPATTVVTPSFVSY